MKLTKSKFFISLILITSMLNMTACTSHKNIGKPKTKVKKHSASVKTNTIHVKKKNKSNASANTNNSAKATSKPKSITLKSITRDEAKLSTIPTLDFSRFTLNTQISNLINNVTSYNDNEFSTGIVKDTFYGDIYIITERYEPNIIQNINIGTSMAYIKNILGTPSSAPSKFIVYKTKQYYIGFKGNGKLEQAIVIKKPKPYNPEILNTILLTISKGIYLRDNKIISNFIDVTHFIHGGSVFDDSLNGVVIKHSNKDNITIYNNFEGKLFHTNIITVIYKNEDYVANILSETLDTYLNTSDEFKTDGKLSPSGKFKSIYDWYNSQEQYFTIRRTDFSKCDFYIGASATQDYKWLSDDYILYSNGYDGSPQIIKVSSYENDDNTHTDKYSDISINVLYRLKIIPDDEEINPILHLNDYKIKAVKNNIIFTEVSDKSNNKKTYEIKYWFDKNGEIQLSL